MKGYQKLMSEDWVSTGQASYMLRVSVPTIVRWEQQGKLESVRTPGGQRRYKRVDIERIAEAKENLRLTFFS